MNVCYLGPLRDYSGYGEANRHAAAALDAAGVNVIAKLVSYVSDASDFGTLGPIVKRLEANTGDYRIKVLHTTPNEYRRFIEPGKYHVGHFFWETDKVPDDFAQGLELMDEVWTGSKANRDAIQKAGVTKPVFIFPQAIETERKWPKAYQLRGFNGYLFYSIFEWTERKNPEALLRAFWEEFKPGENVGLLLKTYFRDFTHQNKQMILDKVATIKAELGLDDSAPPVFVYSHLMDREQVMRLHKTGNVFVSAHHGEGWGVPQAEAMLAGNPIISTDYGGVHEYLTHMVHGIMLPYDMVPVRGMGHSSTWYSPDQNWAQPSQEALRKGLRFCFSQQTAAKVWGDTAQLHMQLNFNLKKVGDLMAARLQEIEAAL